MSQDRRVLLFLARGFEDLEAVAIRDVCGWTEYRDHLPKCRVTTTAFHHEVTGRFGSVAKADVLFSEIDPKAFDALALPGGFYSHGFQEAHDARLHEVARAIHDKGGTIATMCVGIVPIAESGLLKGRRATTYPHSRKHDHAATLRSLGAVVVDEQVVMDERIISCSGPAHAVRVGLLLIEALAGTSVAKEVATLLTCA